MKAWIVIAAGGVGTYLIRASFLSIAERTVGLPPRVREALRMIPPAALAALVAPALLRPDGPLDLLTPESLAGTLALIVAWWTESALLTIVVGMAAIVMVEQLLPIG